MADIFPRQARAIEALLVTSTVRQAAKKAAVPERTLYRWLAEDRVFQAEYRRARRRMFTTAVSRLASLSETAVRELRKILREKTVSPRDRLVAIRTILENARATEEADVTALVEKLESLIGRDA